jgi:hypothetical protein
MVAAGAFWRAVSWNLDHVTIPLLQTLARGDWAASRPGQTLAREANSPFGQCKSRDRGTTNAAVLRSHPYLVRALVHVTRLASCQDANLVAHVECYLL